MPRDGDVRICLFDAAAGSSRWKRALACPPWHVISVCGSRVSQEIDRAAGGPVSPANTRWARGSISITNRQRLERGLSIAPADQQGGTPMRRRARFLIAIVAGLAVFTARRGAAQGGGPTKICQILPTTGN